MGVQDRALKLHPAYTACISKYIWQVLWEVCYQGSSYLHLCQCKRSECFEICNTYCTLHVTVCFVWGGGTEEV